MSHEKQPSMRFARFGWGICLTILATFLLSCKELGKAKSEDPYFGGNADSDNLPVIIEKLRKCDSSNVSGRIVQLDFKPRPTKDRNIISVKGKLMMGVAFCDTGLAKDVKAALGMSQVDSAYLADWKDGACRKVSVKMTFIYRYRSGSCGCSGDFLRFAD